MTQLVASLPEHFPEDISEIMSNIDEIEALLEKIPGVGLLNYAWDMGADGNGPFRSKVFVYTKGPQC